MSSSATPPPDAGHTTCNREESNAVETMSCPLIFLASRTLTIHSGSIVLNPQSWFHGWSTNWVYQSSSPLLEVGLVWTYEPVLTNEMWREGCWWSPSKDFPPWLKEKGLERDVLSLHSLLPSCLGCCPVRTRLLELGHPSCTMKGGIADTWILAEGRTQTSRLKWHHGATAPIPGPCTSR